MPPGPHVPGALVYFHHRDAIAKPKPRRPGVVEALSWARLTLFYGSTFKRGGYPRDAIEANPRGDPGTPARELADYLAGFIDEPTFFHGSLVSETSLQDEGLKHFPQASFPNDLLDDLREQAEDRLLAFLDAWKRLGWLQPDSRARLLDALWWRLHADATTQALVTLVLCDGWTITEIAAVVWRDVDLREGAAAVAGRPRRLLPHTASVLRRLPAGDPGASPWGDLDRDAILEKLRLGWESLTRLAQPKGRKSSMFPRWDQVRSRIDPP